MKRVCHLMEAFLDMRQAYLYDLVNQLDALTNNEVWCFKRRNPVAFPYPKVHSLDQIGIARRSFVRFKTRVSGSRSNLATFCSRAATNPMVAHGHFLWMASATADMKRSSGVATCLTSYGEDEVFRGEARNASLAVENADVLLAPSMFLVNLLNRLTASSKAQLWRLGIDPKRYSIRLHSNATDPTVLMVGRLIDRKGYEFMIEAIPQIRKEVKGARFVLVGEGPERETLVRRAKELGIEDCFTLEPPRPKINDLFSRADVFVQPAVVTGDGVTEGVGVPILEAQASGVPVVASSVGGIPESLSDGETGVLVPQRDPGRLASAVARLLHDRELRSQMGAAGRRRVEEEFSLGIQASKLASIYEGLV